MIINELGEVVISEIYPKTDVTVAAFSNNIDLTGIPGGYNTIRVEYIKTGAVQGSIDFEVQYSALDTTADLAANPLALPLTHYRLMEDNGYVSSSKKLNMANIPVGTTIREFTFDRVNTINNSKKSNIWYRIKMTPTGVAGTNEIKLTLIKN